MSSPISGVSSSPYVSTQSAAPTATSSNTDLANQTTFLSLLVTQLKNQDPLKPTDSTQFVTQLAQFSQLEDLQNINKNVINISQGITAANAGAANAPVTS